MKMIPVIHTMPLCLVKTRCKNWMRQQPTFFLCVRQLWLVRRIDFNFPRKSFARFDPRQPSKVAHYHGNCDRTKRGGAISLMSQRCYGRRKDSEVGSPTSGERAKFSTFSVFVAAVLMTITGAVAYLFYELNLRFTNLLPSNVGSFPVTDDSYIYPHDPLADEPTKWKVELFPWWIQEHDPSFRIARRLVQDARSKDPERRRKAIAVLAELALEEYHYDQLSHMVDFEVGVGLAHSNATHRFIRTYGSSLAKNPDLNVAAWFRELLSELPPDGIHECLLDMTSAALRDFHPSEQELEILSYETLTGFESESLLTLKLFTKKKLTEQEFLKACLQALLSHSRVAQSIPTLLRHKVVDVLMIIAETFRGNDDLMQLIVKIFANLSCSRDFPDYMKETGCLRLLTEFAASTDIKLYLPAKRALHNLDREYNAPILPPGVYQLYPDFRSDEESLDIDIIFVHGLLGGAFRTWRKEDNKGVMRMSAAASSGYIELLKSSVMNLFSKSPQQPSKVPEMQQDDSPNSICPISRCWEKGEWVINSEIFSTYDDKNEGDASQCWPRDWLPKDVPNARILAVDFDSFVTHWARVCPVENTGRTMFERTTELMEKLVTAEVGKRPVVWVTHSMGGLLVKQLLTRSSESSDEKIRRMAEKTRAAVFFSVPHMGSNVASQTAEGAARILMPTLEVKELVYGSQELKKLNEKFKKLRLDNHYKIVSFGETKDVPVSSLGVKLMLVPLSSADPGYGDFYAINVNHLNVCKVRSRNAFVYQKVVEVIQNARTRAFDFDDGEYLSAPIMFHATGKEKSKSRIFLNPFSLFSSRDKS